MSDELVAFDLYRVADKTHLHVLLLIQTIQVAGSTPGQGAITSTSLTQPSIPPGVGKSSTSLHGWG